MRRGHKEDRDGKPRGVGDIFDDEEEADDIPRTGSRNMLDEFAGFIEEDSIDGDKAPGEEDDDADILRKPSRNIIGIKDASGLDEIALEDMKEAFGTGYEYDWALELQEQEEDAQAGIDPDDPDAMVKGIELKDVFEPSQLVDRMLTDEDNRIRSTDQPERFRLARKPYQSLELTEEESREEAIWISDLMLPKKQLDADLREHFQKSVGKVLEFMNIDEYEVPFIFQHRKDYLIHVRPVSVTPDPYNASVPDHAIRAEKLLNQTDLWDIR